MSIKIIKLLATILLLIATANQADCYKLSFPSFPTSTVQKLIMSNESGINKNALQVTLDVRGDNITSQTGRILYKKRFNVWRKKTVSSFNSTFVLNIKPQPDGGGEGLAFILTKDPDVPPNSQGQWLGLVNASTNGSSNIVAVEFDTKKSFVEDMDGNHVGLDIGSMYSEEQVSLNSSNITIASGKDLTFMVIYDGETKVMNVSVFNGNRISQIMSRDLDLSKHLPSKVYIGFSASTGIGSQLNCVRSWYFSGTDIDEDMPRWVWAMIVVLALALLLGVFCGFLCWRAKFKEKQVKDDDDFSIRGIETGLGPKKFKLKDLKAATGNFNTKNELGRGGFGIVYKGILGGEEVAVKRIINNSQEGKQNLIAEVTTIGSLHHKNLVELFGWCYERNELLLVYEYMPNGSLDMLIYCDDKKEEKEGFTSKILSWERRHKIICGVAQALDYLHHECSKRVLHRDIKTSNIMLDSEFNARLGDFGLARMFKLSEKTHHTTKQLVGTPGYMAPEIFHMGRTTAETDVFAFGILVLVVACGRAPGKQDEDNSRYNNNIVDWVWELYKSKVVVNAIDSKLKGDFDKAQAECMLVLGLACCHPNPYMRPSMRTALQILMGEAVAPLVPFEKPAFMWPVSMPSSITVEYSFSEEMLSIVSER